MKGMADYSSRGAGGRIRTDDLEITNHPLYQLSYSGRCVFFVLRNHLKKNGTKLLGCCDPGGIRTHDPQLRRLLLYPAELPDHHIGCKGT